MSMERDLSLQQKFNAYVGRLIKDPERTSMDFDPIAMEIEDLARRYNKTATYTKLGQDTTSHHRLSEDVMPEDFITIDLTKDGVTDEYAWGWCIRDIRIGQ